MKSDHQKTKGEWKMAEIFDTELIFDGTEFAETSATRFKNVREMVKGYNEIIKENGKLSNRIAMPDENSSQEDWEKFYSKVRAKDEDYENVAKSVVPESHKDSFVKAMKDTGLSKKQIEALSAPMKEVLTDAYTKHYSKEALEQKLKDEKLDEELSDLIPIIDEVMGNGYVEKAKHNSNESTIDFLKLAKGLATKYAAKPADSKLPGKTKTTTNGSDLEDAEKAFKAGMARGWR